MAVKVGVHGGPPPPPPLPILTIVQARTILTVVQGRRT